MGRGLGGGPRSWQWTGANIQNVSWTSCYNSTKTMIQRVNSTSAGLFAGNVILAGSPRGARESEPQLSSHQSPFFNSIISCKKISCTDSNNVILWTDGLRQLTWCTFHFTIGPTSPIEKCGPSFNGIYLSLEIFRSDHVVPFNFQPKFQERLAY